MAQSLNLPESLFVVTTNKKLIRFKSKWSGYQKLYFIAACFLELSLQKRIVIDENQEVQVVDQTATGLSYLDEILSKLKENNKNRKLASWLRHFHYRFWQKNKAYSYLIEDLLTKGVITEKPFWFLKQYTGTKTAEQGIVEMIRTEVLEAGKISDVALYLTFVLHVADLLKELFSTYEKEDFLNRIKQLQAEYPQEWKQVHAIYRLIQEELIAIMTSSATT